MFRPAKDRRRTRWAALLSGALFLPGCKGSTDAERRVAPGDTSEAQAPARPKGPSEAEVELRRAMFERLIAEIRRSHVFSSAWPEAEWERQLPALWQEVASATSRVGLWQALRHLSNSLRDGHLKFTPAGTENLRDRVRLPFELINAGSPTHPRLMVSRSELSRAIGPGDELLTYDGVPSAELLDHFQLELNEATPSGRLDQLLSFLQSRFAAEQMEGTVVKLTLQHGAAVVSTEATFSRHGSTNAAAGDGARCPARTRTFGGSYELVEAGAAVCLYRALRAPFASYPIVRHLAFVSNDEARVADHQRVQAFLAATPQVSGVLLDLRDNGGGAAADYVLPWYAPRPHRGLKEWIRLDPDLTDRARLRRALRGDSAVDEYLRRSAGHDQWWVRPFDCGPGGCDDPRRPRLGRVTNAPVALLLGPGCKSACDTFSAIWSRERFGPMVGTPPAAMYTSLRYPLTVEMDGELLGDFTIALCGLRWDASEPWLEGQPLAMDTVVDPSESLLGNELGLLEAAIAALRAWPPPDARPVVQSN
jgi:peptidase S41-like protein